MITTFLIWYGVNRNTLFFVLISHFFNIPRVYTRTVHHKPFVKYTTEQIDTTFVNIDAGLTYRKCSNKHNISTTGLHGHNQFIIANLDKHLKKQGGQCTLSESVEKLIVEQLITC